MAQKDEGSNDGIPCPFRDGGARGREAWINAMPGDGQSMLIVIGEVSTEKGYAGALELTETDKMRPPNQYAKLTLVEASDSPGGWQEIRAETEAHSDAYTSVQIFCHGEVLAAIEDVRTAD